MTTADIALVQGSFRRIVPIADQAAALFYARLFEINPSLRPLFHGNLQDQGRKLIAMLAATVAMLEQPEKLQPTLRALGARHVDYGVREEHYDSVGAALLWTLEKGLGGSFTTEVANAWARLYRLVADTMIDAQRRAVAAA